MIQRPNAIGLVVCQQAVIEEGTRNMTLVDAFNRLTLGTFPTPPQHFTVYALLTDGLGTMTLTMNVAPLDTLEPILTRSWQATFPDALYELRLVARTKSVCFPAPGRYEINLLAEGEMLARRVITLVREEGQS